MELDKIIDGQRVAKERKEILKEKISKKYLELKRYPRLEVILVGNDPGSISYVKGKEKAAKEIDIIINTTHYEDNISEDEVCMKIIEFNNDPLVDGILVQLPLPKHINKNKILNLIKSDKDIDGFHPENVAKLYLRQPGIPACTPKGIMILLDEYNVELSGKNVVVVGRSDIVGMPVSKMLLDRNATVTICHSKTTNLKKHTLEADVIIMACGQPRLLKEDMIKNGVVIIDVGANRDSNNKLCGDVDFDMCYKKARLISPVPKGVGPMTICSLLENTYLAYLIHNNIAED